jgi:hypothetical protein
MFVWKIRRGREMSKVHWHKYNQSVRCVRLFALTALIKGIVVVVVVVVVDVPVSVVLVMMAALDVVVIMTFSSCLTAMNTIATIAPTATNNDNARPIIPNFVLLSNQPGSASFDPPPPSPPTLPATSLSSQAIAGPGAWIIIIGTTSQSGIFPGTVALERFYEVNYLSE